MTNNELLKLIYPTYEAPKCSECGCEINLSRRQMYNLCLVVTHEFEKGNFKGLCPDCTRKWYENKESHIKGYSASLMVIDEI